MINFRQIVHPLQKIFPELMVTMGYIKVQVKVFGRVNRMENPYESNGIRSPDTPTMIELLDFMRVYLFMILNTSKGSLSNRIIRTISFRLSKASLEIG